MDLTQVSTNSEERRDAGAGAGRVGFPHLRSIDWVAVPGLPLPSLLEGSAETNF